MLGKLIDKRDGRFCGSYLGAAYIRVGSGQRPLAFLLLGHSGMDRNKLDVVRRVDALRRTSRISFRIQVVLCAVDGLGFVIDLVEPMAQEHLLRSIDESDGNGQAVRKTPFHTDEAVGILLETDHVIPPSLLRTSSIP